MSNAIEIEAKALIKKADYDKLKKLFKDYPSYVQTNYYIDNKDNVMRKEGFALRVREKEDLYEMTLKTPLSEGLLEKNCSWSKEQFDAFMKHGKFPEGDIKRFLTMLDIDVDTLYVKTSLTTTRIDIPYKGGKLSIDENHYSGLTDYEVELEYNNMNDAKRLVKELFDENGIETKFTNMAKSTRAMDAI